MDELFRPEGQPSQIRHPRLRRQTSVGLGSFFKNTLGNAFLSFFEDSIKSKPSLKENEQTIKLNFKNINEIIDSVDEHIKKRMETYQNEVFEIIKDEISEMKVETEKLVQQLNNKIAEKNVHSELWQIKNQLDYFKIQALKLFQENKGYRVEVKLLKKSIKDLQIDIDTQDQLLQKLRKKYLKEQLRSQKGISQINKVESIKKSREDTFLTQTFGMPRNQREISKSQNRLQQKIQQLSVEQDKAQEQSVIDIRISNNPANQMAVILDYQSEQNRDNSLPSLILRDSMLSNELREMPSVKMTKVESFLQESGPISALKSKFKEAGVQTAPFPIHQQKTKKNESSLGLQFQQAKQSSLQPTPEKYISFSNRFSFNKSSYHHKPKHLQLQQSVRQRQTVRMRTEVDSKQPVSVRYMSNALIKNRLEDLDLQGKKRNKSKPNK